MVFDIQRFAVHDGPGIRVTVFLKGCPLRCAWCQNPESQMMKSELLHYSTRCIHCLRCAAVCDKKAIKERDGTIRISRKSCNSCGKCAQVCPADAIRLSGKRMTVAEVMEEVEKDRAFLQLSGGGVTISGGEPLAQPRFLAEILRACKRKGLHTVLETSGYGSWSFFWRLLGDVDLVLYDLKLIDCVEHKKFTQACNSIIISNLFKLTASGKSVLARMPLIPGYTTSKANLISLARLLRSTGIGEVQLLPYNPLAADKYSKLGRSYELADVRYSDEVKKSAAKLLRDLGICAK